MKCPKCGRRPSERTYGQIVERSDAETGVLTGCDVEDRVCSDSIHDLADQAPALLEALEKIKLAAEGTWEYGENVARAAILAAKGKDQ